MFESKKTKELKELRLRIFDLTVEGYEKDKVIQSSNEEIVKLTQKVAELEYQNSLLHKDLDSLNVEQRISTIKKLNDDISLKQNDCVELDKQAATLKSHIDELNGEIDIIRLGFAMPMFKFGTSKEYKEKIKEVRRKQKQAYKDNMVINYGETLTLNGDMVSGIKLSASYRNMAILSFNLSCDGYMDKCTYLNIEEIKEKINELYDSINEGVGLLGIKIKEYYRDLKLEELQLVFEHQCKLQEEKEERKRQAEIVKEQRKIEQEMEKVKAKLEKEIKHYEKQIDSSDLETQCNAISKVAELREQIESCDYRLANNKAGFVYIINNPSLGKDVYKIGVTRRLEAETRVDELSSASVPFRFSPNAIIFSEDCFALESALHKEFDQYRVNKINKRKEFFNLPLEQIEKTIVNKYGINVEFNYESVDENYILSTQF